MKPAGEFVRAVNYLKSQIGCAHSCATSTFAVDSVLHYTKEAQKANRIPFMKKTIVWLLGVFTLLSMILVDRAEAFTILNVNPTFSGSAGALSGERCSLQGSTSVGCSVG